MKDYDYLEPQTLHEALEIISQLRTEARILAGGTDLLLDVQHKRKAPGPIVSINSIEELCTIQISTSEIRIGAGVTFSKIIKSPIINQKCQMLAEAASHIGSVQIRNVATIGGNLCNALPCADSAAPLAASSAEVVLANHKGTRQMPVTDFIQGPRKTVLGPDEILKEVVLPLKSEPSGSAYQIISTRKALDLTIVGVAIILSIDPIEKSIVESGIALANCSPRPLRVLEAEKLLKRKQISDHLIADVSEIVATSSKVRTSPLRATAEYRRDMVRVLTKRALKDAYERAESGERE